MYSSSLGSLHANRRNSQGRPDIPDGATATTWVCLGSDSRLLLLPQSLKLLLIPLHINRLVFIIRL